MTKKSKLFPSRNSTCGPEILVQRSTNGQLKPKTYLGIKEEFPERTY